MQTIITPDDLRAAIVSLEMRQRTEAALLKEQALLTYESIKPVNMIKNIFRESSESDELRGNLLNTSIGLSAGYASKFLFQGFSGGPVRKILGTAIMFGIKNLVAHNPNTVKKIGSAFFSLIRKLRSKKVSRTQIAESLETPVQ